MSCVNVKSPEYKALVQGMSRREKLIATAVITNYMNENDDKLPTFVELKSLISDLYNTTKSGVDYREFYGEVKAMFKKLLPSISDEEIDKRVKFVDKLELMRLRNGHEVLTSYINDVVYIANSLPKERGTKAYTDVRHEVFHVIFNNFLSEKEQEAMIETFKRWKPAYASEMDKVRLEEAMAEAFEDYQAKKRSIPTLIKEFFEDILRFLGLIGTHYNDIHRLFSDVQNGRFTRNYQKDALVTRDKNIYTNDKFATNPDLLIQAKDFVLNTLNDLMFPAENKNISEATNPNLFLNQSYSGIFQNNKNLFKLGLTKADALKGLQERIKALRATPDLDPQMTRVLDALKDLRDLKDVFDYVQPYSVAEVTKEGELRLKNEVYEDPTEALLESDEEINSLEIGSKELINPHTKISEVVKDFLSSVTYKTNGDRVQGIDPGAGFVALLNLLGGLYGNTSIAENEETLKRAYKATAQGNQTKAVYKRLLELHTNVRSYDRMTLSLKGVPQTEIDRLRADLDRFGMRYEISGTNATIIIPENMKIENQGTNNVDNEVVFTLNRFGTGQPSFLIRQGYRSTGERFAESNKAFVERVAQETGIPNFIVNRLFIYNEERNQLAEITKVAGSLRKLSPKFLRISTSRQMDAEGRSANVTSFAYINRVSEYRQSISMASLVRESLAIPSIRTAVVAAVRNYIENKNRWNEAQVKDTLRQIVVGHLGAITGPDFTKISSTGDTPRLMNSLERLVVSVPDLSTGKELEEFDKADLFLRYTSQLADMLTKYTNEKNNPTSFNVSTSNKKKWENVMKNSGWMIFKNLEDFARGAITANNLLPYLRNALNNYLRFNPIFDHNYSNNTISVNKNLLKVGDEDFYSDHQETYFENRGSFYQKPPIPFSKETPRDWINRNFLAMFQLAITENPSKTGLSYFQQKFQPESAPNVSVVKMGINTAEQLENNIMMMILQEGYMAHRYSNSIRGNLRKNTSKSYLPGLVGTSYFISNGQNVFFNSDGTLKSEFGSIVNGRLQINRNNRTLRNLYDTILSDLDSSLDEFVDMAITEKATLDGADLSLMYDKIKNAYPEQYKLSTAEINTLRGFGINEKVSLEDLRDSEQYPAQRAALKKVMAAYYLNSFVNGFFMNQLSSGATQNYKNPLDEIKRQAGVNAMNDTGLIDDKHGIKNRYKNVVIAGANNFYGASHKFARIPVLQRFFRNKKQEVGDAQTWDLPEYKQMLRKSFGKSVDIGVITKDVHNEANEEGGIDYRKTSSAELTNELVKKNKTLRDLRYAMTFGGYNIDAQGNRVWYGYLGSLSDQQRGEKQARIDYLYNKMIDNANASNRFDGLRNDVEEYMEYQSILKDVQDGDFMIHKASFDSAIKGSKPKNLSQFIKDQETGTFNFQFHAESVLTLNSAYTGIQQAIRHRYIDSFISHFTQLTYLIGLNRTETSIKNNKTITRTLSKFAKAGIFDLLFDYRMAYDDNEKLLKANNRSKKEFITDIEKKLDMPGNERLLALLKTKGISMNNPLFSEKLMQSFFNTLTKKTVAPKHPGGSFVLQSEFGFEANKILEANSMRIPEVVTDAQGNLLYAECYLPEMYSDQIKAGDMIYYNSEHYAKMFGFRIPSSDLHSSVPLRVIGYYPSFQHDNVVVIPSAVTALHGSDFDVDKLFVVRYGVFGVKDDNNVSPVTGLDKEEHERIEAREYKTRFQGTNIVIGQKSVKFGYTAPNAVYDNKNNLTSFGENDVHVEINNLDSILLDEKEKTQAEIIRLEVEKEEFDKTPALTPREKNAKIINRNARYDKPIKELREHLSTLRNIQKGLFSNTILDAVLDNISYAGENAEDILFGITFDPVKGYEETSEYSQLARVMSDINRANGIEDQLPARPTLFANLDEARVADEELVDSVERELRENLGVDTTTPEGQEDLLNLVNDELKDNWVGERDAFMARQRGTGSVNINKVEQHATVHKETYMAAGLVGLIANFSKGLAYAFHGLTDNSTEIQLDINNGAEIVIDGETFNSLSLVNRDGIKTQELRSLALNAAIDHVKEQILNVLNVGNKTAKIFLAAISTKMSLHQATMVMLQPVAKELNSSNAGKVNPTLTKIREAIEKRLEEMGQALSEQEIDEFQVTTAKLERLAMTTWDELFSNQDSPTYRQDLLLQFKVANQLTVLETIGNEVSKLSSVLSVIQGLPYNLEGAYEKLSAINDFINVEKFFDKLRFRERSEYTEAGFKDDLRSDKNLFLNVNLANNENVLAALEAIKVQVDVISEMFSENSLQMQFLINNIIKAISDNSDPMTLFTGPNDVNLTFDTTQNMTIAEKYLKGKNMFNMIKLMSRNIFNFLTSGLYMSYNEGQHLFSLNIQNQGLLTMTSSKDNREFTLSVVRSYVNSFLMNEGDAYNSDKSYKGEDYVVSQINPEWRLKPLTVIKKELKQKQIRNSFLEGLGVDTNFRDNVRIMTFNGSAINSAENLAEIEQSVNSLNNLTGIYVRYNESTERWEEVPSTEQPHTPEMNEITFNILKTSMYVDKFKFSMSRATNVIPPSYYRKIFETLETLTKDLLYYRKNEQGEKYYKSFFDLNNTSNVYSALGTIKENLFINTIFSIPTVLPNLRSILPSEADRKGHIFKQAGILPNGNIYDLYLDSKVMDTAKEQEVGEDDQAETTVDMVTNPTNNAEVADELEDSEAEGDLFEKFRKNPSFIVEEDYRKKGNYEIFMKVGESGSKNSDDHKLYYKKIANINSKVTNNSFDQNLLLNRYAIRDYFNPKRLAIPVKGVDLSQDEITLENVPIRSFMMNMSDRERTIAENSESVAQAIEEQMKIARATPGNENRTDDELRRQIRTKINVENVISKVNEVSLYDSRNIDRIGIKNYQVLTSQISEDRRTVTYTLRALANRHQVSYITSPTPLVILDTVSESRNLQEKIDFINNTPGARVISKLSNMTEAEINLEYQRAMEIRQGQEVDEAVRRKNCG